MHHSSGSSKGSRSMRMLSALALFLLMLGPGGVVAQTAPPCLPGAPSPTPRLWTRRPGTAGGSGNLATDVVIREGRGGRVWDESGNEYVDFLLGSGPMLVGHAHPEVTAAAQAQVPRGTTFFVNNRHGIELAARIVEAVPCA